MLIYLLTSLEHGPGLSLSANCDCSVTTLSSDGWDHNLFYSITDTSNTSVFYQLAELWLPTFCIHAAQRKINLMYFKGPSYEYLTGSQSCFFCFVLFLK